MKTNSRLAWNILSITLSCFLFITASSRGMFSEGYEEKKKAEEAAKAAAEQQARIARASTTPENQGNESGAAARGVLSFGKGPSEKSPEKIQEEESTRIISKSYFSSLTQQEEDQLVNEVDSRLRSMEQFRKRSDRTLSKEDYVFFIAETIAKKAGVSNPGVAAEETVTAYPKTVAEIGSKLGLEGRPAEEVAEISGRVREFEREAMIFEDPELTEEGRINLAARFAEKIDARKAAARAIADEQRRQKELEESRLAEIDARKAAALAQQRSQQAGVTHLASSASTQAAVAGASSAAPNVVKAAGMHLTSAAAKAPAVAPLPKPPGESAFEKQKRASLQDLQKRLGDARSELARHEAMRNTLNEHVKNVKRAKADIAKFEEENPVRMFTSIFKPSVRLGNLYNAETMAIRGKTIFENANGVTLESLDSSINTLSSRIHKLEQEHTQVASSEDPIIVEQRRQQEAAARAMTLEQQRQQDLVVAKAGARDLRRRLEAEYGIPPQEHSAAHLPSEEMKRMSLTSSRTDSDGGSPLSTPPGALKREGSDSSQEALRMSRSTSGGESPGSTPERVALTPAALEIQRLQAEITGVHKAVSEAMQFISDNRGALFTMKGQEYFELRREFFRTWDRYWDLATQRSALHQHLASLTREVPRFLFKGEAKEAWMNMYKTTVDRQLLLFGDGGAGPFRKGLKQIYIDHRVADIDIDRDRDVLFKQQALKQAWANRSTLVQQLEHNLNQRFQKEKESATREILQAELRLVAAEERPEILQQIEDSIWPSMPGFSEEERVYDLGLAWDEFDRARFEAELRIKYPAAYRGGASSGTYSSSSSSWQIDQMQRNQWNAGQTWGYLSSQGTNIPYYK